MDPVDVLPYRMVSQPLYEDIDPSLCAILRDPISAEMYLQAVAHAAPGKLDVAIYCFLVVTGQLNAAMQLVPDCPNPLYFWNSRQALSAPVLDMLKLRVTIHRV